MTKTSSKTQKTVARKKAVQVLMHPLKSKTGIRAGGGNDWAG